MDERDLFVLLLGLIVGLAIGNVCLDLLAHRFRNW
jgi:uncharacterized membrane-anchored protein YhcB (DUF1043 family)